jgi:hypothetical protein
MIESKRALRRKLAALPVAEKLRMLDALRERELAIRGRAAHSDSSGVREEPAPYLSDRRNVDVAKRTRFRKQGLSVSIPLSVVSSLLSVMTGGGEGEEENGVSFLG